MTSVVENLNRIRERIASAARRAGHDPAGIELMAVSKTVEPARIREAYQAGQRLFGENRVQEFGGKWPELRELEGARWHLIGHLQSNKASRAAELFSQVESVDSLRLAQRLNAAAEKLGKRLPVLLEFNLGGEQSKSGLAPGSKEIDELLAAVPALGHLEIAGVMTIPPFTEDPEDARPYFRRLRELRDRLGLKQLSMGMSHDFEVAVEEGSTCVRVGTGIFGERRK